MDSIISGLSEIERTVLKNLSDDTLELEKISKKAGMNLDSVRRAVNWLKEKKLVELVERKKTIVQLTLSGEEFRKKGAPEKRLLHYLNEHNGKVSLEEAKNSGLSAQEFNVALGLTKKMAFTVITKHANKVFIELTEVGREFMEKKSAEEKVVEKIYAKKSLTELDKEERKVLSSLMQRGLVEKKEVTEWKVKINSEGVKALKQIEKVHGRTYNVQGAVPQLFIGKRQPYIQFLNKIRKKLVELGFKEVPPKLVELEFYNFDVLFQPQNHPARSWSDTYQMKTPTKGKLPNAKIVKKVKDAHEFGGKTSSIGWCYKWNPDIAKRLMPCAHGTSASARQLVEGVEVPGKYFAIARCFRPDVVDATHLNEFNQMDGFIVDKSFNFRHLLGMLRKFAIEIAGATEVKFYPDYYPFTEPSVQLSAKHPRMGWFEFGGAGIFRPEITEQLGIKGRALAWGLGIDRLAMCALNIKDIRYLFSNDLSWLRIQKMVG